MQPIRFASLLLVPIATLAIAACGGSQTQTEEAYIDAMATEHADETPTPNIVAPEPVELLVGDAVYHTVDGQEIAGYHARPAAGATAGIVLVHEWWGLNDNMRAAARNFALQGYAVLAVDIYNGASAETADAARALMTQAFAEPAAIIQNTSAAAGWLRENAGASRVAVMGYCFGGAVSLNTAIGAADAIDASVIYYGRVTDDVSRLQNIDDPMLGIFGAQDQGIPVEDVHAFAAAAERAGVDLELHVLDADHAFANPSGERYDAEASAQAWDLTIDFLERTLTP